MLKRDSLRIAHLRASCRAQSFLIVSVVLSILFGSFQPVSADSVNLATVGGAIQGYQGPADFYKKDDAGNVLHVTVDYAVFAPGSLNAVSALGSLSPLIYTNTYGPGQGGIFFNPSATDYVYAYQIIPDADSNVSVGLASIGSEASLWTGNNPSNFVSPITSVGQLSPGSASAVAATSAQVDDATVSPTGKVTYGDATDFSFANPISYNQSSYFLLVASKYSPVMDPNAVAFGSYITGGLGVNPIGDLTGPASDLPIPLNTGGNGGVAAPLPTPWVAGVVMLAAIPLVRLVKRIMPARS